MNEREIYYLGRRIRETRKDIAFEKSKSCFIKMIVSKIILVIKPLIIASIIIPKTGNGILVN